MCIEWHMPEISLLNTCLCVKLRTGDEIPSLKAKAVSENMTVFHNHSNFCLVHNDEIIFIKTDDLPVVKEKGKPKKQHPFAIWLRVADKNATVRITLRFGIDKEKDFTLEGKIIQCFNDIVTLTLTGTIYKYAICRIDKITTIRSDRCVFDLKSEVVIEECEDIPF